MAHGISASEAKKIREGFNVEFNHSKVGLRCPELDDDIFLRLKERKGSSATKKSIDPLEKSLTSLQYKIMDVARPLISLWTKKSARKFRKPIFAAIKLWSLAFAGVTKLRRLNILKQLYPHYVPMLDQPNNFDVQQYLSLFGSKFTSGMVRDANNAAKMKAVVPQSGSSSRSNGGKYSAGKGGGHSSDRNGGPYRSGQRGQRSHRGRYVQSSLALTSSMLSSAPSRVGGRLKAFASAWLGFTRDPWVISTVREGLRLELVGTPSQFNFPPDIAMGDAQSSVCDSEVRSLLDKGAIKRADSPGFVSSFFAIPKRSGGFRPIINLKPFNQFVRYRHFQMEGLPAARHLVRRGDWMAKIDLTDAFLTVPVHPDDQHFLQFSWGGELYQFVAMPFGLASAPRVFTKLLKPLASYLRSRGVRLVVYLDDILIVASSESQLREHLGWVVEVFESVGFIINREKSIVDPARVLEFLGFLLNTVGWTVSIPGPAAEKLSVRCRDLLNSPSCSLRDLAALLGYFTWATPAVPFARANCRSIQRLYIEQAKKSDGDLQARVTLPEAARCDLQWWIDHLGSSGCPILMAEPDLAIFSDASNTGWGAACGGSSTGGPWTLEQGRQHINCLELQAGFNGLRCFADCAIGSTIELNMDNTTAVAYINKMGGTRSPHLNSLALEIAQWCESRKINLYAVHVPGILNVLADQESRRAHDSGDWMLSRSLFSIVQNRWELDTDLFATSWNAQLPKFVSWKPQPGCWRTNAFSFSWKEVKGYAFPPFRLIGQCLSKVQRDQTELILICPYWPTQPWFPLLLELTSDIPLVLRPSPSLLQSSQGETHPLVSSGSILLTAWKLSGIASDCINFRNQWSGSSSPAPDKPHTLLTRRRGVIGTIGAFNGTPIPCQTI